MSKELTEEEFQELLNPKPVVISPKRRDKTCKWSKIINWYSLGLMVLMITFTALSITDSLEWFVPIDANILINPFVIIMSIIFIVGITYWLIIRWWFYGSSRVMKYELKWYFKLTTSLVFVTMLACLLSMSITAFSSGLSDSDIEGAVWLQGNINRLNTPEFSFIYEPISKSFGGKFTVQAYIDAYLSGKRGLIVDQVPGLSEQIDNYLNTNGMDKINLPISYIVSTKITLSSKDFIFMECYGLIQAALLVMFYFKILFNLGASKY